MERTPCNRHEMELMELLMFTTGILRQGEKKTIDRIRKVKRGPWRFHMAIALLEKLFLDLAETITEGNKRQLYTLQKNGRLSIKPQPIADIPGYYLLPRDTGNAIIESCIRNECMMCIKEYDEAMKCPLYKAMIDVMPPDNVKRYVCPYQAIDIYHDEDEADAHE